MCVSPKPAGRFTRGDHQRDARHTRAGSARRKKKYRRRFVDQLHDDELTVLDVAAATHGVQLVIAQQAGVLVLPELPRSGLDPVHGSLPGFCHACPSSDPGAWFKALCCVTDVPTKATSG